jgi:hypothetical protein
LLIIFIYLTTLFIAPQLWVPPIIGLPVGLSVYPLWLLAIVLARKENFWTLTVQDKFFLLMLLWIVLSMALSGFHEHSTELITNYVKWFVLYKLVASTVSSPQRPRYASLMLVFFALVLAIEGVQHSRSDAGLGWAGQTFGWIDPSATNERGRTRWINIFDGPGVFCVAYTVALPFLLQYLARPFNYAVRLLAGLSLCLLVSAIYLTGSRGGFLTTIAVFGLFMAIRYKVSVPRMAVAGVVIWIAFAVAPAI